MTCWVIPAVTLLACAACVGGQAGGQNPMSPDGYRLPLDANYLIVAGEKVRPQQTYRVYVTIFRLFYPELRVRAQLSRDGDEYASNEVLFYEATTKRLELAVPENAQAGGVHKLVVEGLLNTASREEAWFRNETVIKFDTKYVSMFIQTDRPMYYPGQTVNFRVVGVTPDLKPMSGTITVYVVDAGGRIVMRWLQQQLIFGMFEKEFDLTYPVADGNWTIRVDGFGHQYEQPFGVEFWWVRRYEINMTTPLYIFDTEWGVAGSLYGEHLSGILIKGNATIRLMVRDGDEGEFMAGEIRKKIDYIRGAQPFEFTMKEITEKWGDVSGKELHFKSWIYDWLITEEQNASSVTRVIKDGIRVQVLGRRIRTFKPEIPFMTYFAISRTDGSPYKGFYDRQVVVQQSHEGDRTRTSEDKLILPDDGIIRHQVSPLPGDKIITVRISHTASGIWEETEFYRYYSPNNRFLSVSSSTESPVVNQYMIFTVKTNTYVPEIQYLIMGGGSILLGDSLRMNSLQKTFSVAVSREMSPTARIVVYYMKETEVVSDVLNFPCKDSRLMTATTQVNLGKDFQQDYIELITRGAPGGFASLIGMDYELWRRGADTFIDEEKIIEELQTYDEGNQQPFQAIWYHNDERWEESVFFPAPTDGMDTVTTFNISGLIIFTDLNLTVIPDQIVCNISLGLGRCPSGQCFEIKKACDGIIDCVDGYDETGCPLEHPPIRRPPDIKNLDRLDQCFPNAKWLWLNTYIKFNGQVETRMDVPSDNTDAYVIHGIVIHPDEGLQIIKEPAQYLGTSFFYMVVEAPPWIRRGEMIGVQCSVFNFWEEDLEVIVTLHAGDDYRFVVVEDFGRVSSYAPRTASGDHLIMLELKSGEGRYVHFPIVPIIPKGEITVKVSAYSMVMSDTEEVTMEITVDGVVNDDYTPFLIDLVNQGSIIIPDFDVPVPEMFWHPEVPYHLYIPESPNGVMNMIGDVSNPGMWEEHLTTDGNVGAPHDSAEGYMTDYALNLQNLRFLQQTNSLTDKAAQGALTYMKSILMRQYAYMQKNGAFRNFRRVDGDSLWTTSICIRWLHETVTSEWNEDVFVPVEIINKAALWLAQQQKPEGYFVEETAPIYDRMMDPATKDNSNVTHDWHVTLTSHIVITFSATTRLTGLGKVEADAARLRGAEYLSTRYSEVTDVMQMGYVAYALHVSNHRTKDDAYQRFKKMRQEGESIYWARQQWPTNPTRIVNTVNFMESRPDFPDLGAATTATAFGLMLYLAHNEFQNAIPIMKWLNSQRMGQMAWSGTQDTLLATQALNQFVLRETNRDIYQMEVRLESTASPDWSKIWKYNNTNSAKYFESELPVIWGQVKAYAKGTGYAMLSMYIEHNVERPDQLSLPDYEAFEFDIPEMRFSGRNASIMEITVCTRYTMTSETPFIRETWMGVSTPTGFVMSRDTIWKIYSLGIPGLRRVAFRDNTVVLMFDKLTTTKTCVPLKLERWYPVANMSIQHLIEVYEYAESGLQGKTLYEAWTLHGQHICFVCGSYQCPYCPYYNTGPQFLLPHVMLIICAVFAIFTPLWVVQTGPSSWTRKHWALGRG